MFPNIKAWHSIPTVTFTLDKNIKQLENSLSDDLNFLSYLHLVQSKTKLISCNTIWLVPMNKLICGVEGTWIIEIHKILPTDEL